MSKDTTFKLDDFCGRLEAAVSMLKTIQEHFVEQEIKGKTKCAFDCAMSVICDHFTTLASELSMGADVIEKKGAL